LDSFIPFVGVVMVNFVLSRHNLTALQKASNELINTPTEIFVADRNVSNRIIIESRNCLFCGTRLLLTVNSGVVVIAASTCGTRFWQRESIRIEPGQIGFCVLLENSKKKKKQYRHGT